MKYTMVREKYVNDLIFVVNTLIKQGWSPLGGISHDSTHYIQAMVKHAH